VSTNYIYQDIPLIFRALDSRQRIQMLQYLAYRHYSVGELADEVGLRQSTASYHLDILRQAGLVNHDGGAGIPSAQTFELVDRFVHERLWPRRQQSQR